MSRVEWSRRTADEVETVIGVMLCRANPAAVRVRPSRGDKGVDVYVPVGDKWTVYQVKSFTASLTASRKSQITKSWNTFRDFAKEQGWQIEAWHLLRPENPTWEDQEWLEKLTEGAEFPCSWRGLDFCEALASDHQAVIDYYFFDGKERLQSALQDLMAATALRSGSDLITPGESFSALDGLHNSSNEHDPHYRYDFAVDTVEGGALPPIASRPGMVAAVTRSHDATAITFRIFARYREATADRPVPGKFTLVAEPNSDDALALQDFRDYGIGIDAVTARDLDLDLPGGLGGAHREGTVSLGPARLATSRGTQLQLVILDPTDDIELCFADLDMEPATTGLDGQKFAVAGMERAGVFSITIRADPGSQKLKLSFASLDLTGSFPADVLPGLRVIEVLRPPNRMLLRMRNGPALDDPHDIPSALDGDVDGLIRVCDALATIQLHTVTQVVIPDLSETPVEEAREWFRAARLLKGDTLTMTWNQVGVELREGAELPDVGTDGAYAVATTTPLTVKVNDVEIELGYQLTQLAAARIDPDDLQDGTPRSSSVHLIPAGNDEGTVRWVGRDQPPELEGDG